MTGLLWAFAVAATVAGPTDLTLDDAVQIALDNAYAIRIAQSQADQAKANQGAAAGALRPQLNGQGQYTRLAEGVSNSFGGSGFGGSTSDSKQLNLTLTQLIDVFGVSRSTVEAARFQKLSSEMGVETQQNEIKSLVRTQFFKVLQTRSLIQVQDDEVKSAKQRLANAIVKEAAGDVSHFDVIRLQTELKRSEQALLSAKSDHKLARNGLNSLLGRAIDTEFDPVDVPAMDGEVIDPQDAIALAYELRPEVRSGGYLVQAADKLVEFEKGGLKPKVSVSAQYSRVIDPAPGQVVQSLFGIFTISFPLWDSGITRSRVTSARAARDQAALRLDQTKQNVELEVRNAITQLETAREAYEVATSGKEVAAEAFRLAQLRYDEGAGILLDVTTAQTELTRAQSAVVTARYQVLSAIAALQRAVGRDDLSVEAGKEVGL